MSYTAPTSYPTGHLLTAAEYAQQIADNITYLKSQTDLLFVTAKNNDSVTINAGDVVIFDPTYTSGLGVKLATVSGDLRVCGVVKDATIAAGASGLIAIGHMIINANVTGAVTFGHSLITSATTHYAEDSGGTGWAAGVLGWALAANVSGNATISILLMPYPQLYGAGANVVRTQTKDNASTTWIVNAISDGSNRAMLLFYYNGTTGSAANFNGVETFTAYQNAASDQVYFGWLKAPTVVTADITATSAGTGCAVLVVLNGVNQTTPFGTYAHDNQSSAVVTVSVPSVVGELCIAGFKTSTDITVSSRGSGQTELANVIKSGGSMRVIVDKKIATGATTDFTWNLSASADWDGAGVAVKNA